MTFAQGTRVVTRLGGELRSGTVAYVRMCAPNFSEPAAYSLLLDGRKNDISYTGTIVPASRVWLADELVTCSACGARLIWSELLCVGKYADAAEAFELRNCPCGGTNSRLLPR